LYKPWFPGVGRGLNREKPYFNVFILKKIFFFRTSRPISIKLGTNHSFGKGNSKLYKSRARSFSKGR
jgi:hypothetical protein